MLYSLFLYLNNYAYEALKELQLVLCYFNEHYLFGLIFILHIVLLRFKKLSIDNTNLVYWLKLCKNYSFSNIHKLILINFNFLSLKIFIG